MGCGVRSESVSCRSRPTGWPARRRGPAGTGSPPAPFHGGRSGSSTRCGTRLHHHDTQRVRDHVVQFPRDAAPFVRDCALATGAAPPPAAGLVPRARVGPPVGGTSPTERRRAEGQSTDPQTSSIGGTTTPSDHHTVRSARRPRRLTRASPRAEPGRSRRGRGSASKHSARRR